MRRIESVEVKHHVRNLFLATALALLVLWIAYESAKQGVFTGWRSKFGSHFQPPTEVAALKSNPTEPTPTPLPPHFPTVEDDELRDEFPVETQAAHGLSQAFKLCWPAAAVTDAPLDKAMDTSASLEILERLFGKIKKREILEESDAIQRVGLLFDSTVFEKGAAGWAELKGNEVGTFQLRANGRMLHCETPDICECLSSIAP